MLVRVLVAVLAGLALVLAACGGDDGANDGPGVSDEEYLKVVCTGVQAFSDALIRATTAEAIARSINDFAAALRAVQPPADLDDFHDDLLKYLDDSVADPTSLVTRRRPQPSEKARERLAALEPSVPECERTGYFAIR